jgi:hypothetical protein
MFHDVVQSLLCDTVQAGRYVHRQSFLRQRLLLECHLESLSRGELVAQLAQSGAQPEIFEDRRVKPVGDLTNIGG